MVFEVRVHLPMREVDGQGGRGQHGTEVRERPRQRDWTRPDEDRDGRGHDGLALEVREEPGDEEHGGDGDRHALHHGVGARS